MVRVRHAEAEDLEAIARIEAACFAESERYDADELSRALDMPSYQLLVAEEELATGANVIGFALLERVGASVHFVDLAVDPGNRGRGVGTLLAQASLDWARQAGGARRAYAEVRASNGTSARGLERLGFVVSGTTSGYYQDPAEDALVLSRPLP